MSYSEFPHTNYEDTDFHELIELYKKLVDEYDGTLQKITELSNRLDEYQNTMTNHINTEVDSRVQIAINVFGSTIESDINTLKTSVTNLNAKLDSYYDVLDNLVKTSSEHLQEQIDELNTEDEVLLTKIVNLSIKLEQLREETASNLDLVERQLHVYVDNKSEHTLLDAKLYTEQQINALDYKLSEEIKAIAEASGNTAIEWLWDNCCCHGGFDGFQWYMLSEITAKDWSNMNATAVEWYTNAKEIYWRFDSRNKMFSPVTGEFVDVRKAVYELANALNINAMTALEYDSLMLTADVYDREFITAYEYDWSEKGERECLANRQNI